MFLNDHKLHNASSNNIIYRKNWYSSYLGSPASWSTRVNLDFHLYVLLIKTSAEPIASFTEFANCAIDLTKYRKKSAKDMGQKPVLLFSLI